MLNEQLNHNNDIYKNEFKDIVTKINYYSINYGYSDRVVHTYGPYNYKSDKYMVVFCENKNKLSQHMYYIDIITYKNMIDI